MITDACPRSGAPPAEPPRGRRLLGPGAGPAEPPGAGRPGRRASCSSACWRPDLLTTGGLAGVLDVAALWASARWPSPCCWSPASSTSPSASSPSASALLTALLVAQAGWGTWPALLGSLAAPCSSGWSTGAGGQHRAAQLPGHAGDLPGAAGHRRGRRRWPSAGSARVDRAGGGRGLGSRPPPSSPPPWRSATAGSASRCCGSLGGHGAGHLGAVAHPLRQRGVRHRRRPAGGPELGVPVRRTTVALFCLTAAAGWLIGTLGADPAGRRAGAARPGPGYRASTSSSSRSSAGACSPAATARPSGRPSARCSTPSPGRASRWPAGTRCGSRRSSACCCWSPCSANGVVRRRLRAAPRS